MGDLNNVSATDYAYMLAEYTVIKRKNNELAKELAQSRNSYAIMLNERNYLHTQNTNLLMENGVLNNYISTILQNAKEVLQSIVTASTGLSTIICSKPTVLGEFEKSRSINYSNSGNKSQNLSTSINKQTANSAMKPIVRINKLRDFELAALSTSQQNSTENNNSTLQLNENEEEEEDNDLDNDQNGIDENTDDSNTNSDGFETIAEEEEENMYVRDNVETNVSNYIDVVPSNAGTLVSTAFKNVNPRVFITPSQEIEALTGNVSIATQEENSLGSSINSNFSSPIVAPKRKVKRLISPNNMIMNSARKKANLERRTEESSNKTENEIYMSRTPRMTRSRINTTEGELSVPRLETRRVATGVRKTLETSLNSTESDHDLTSRNTENSSLINNFGSSNYSSDSTDNTLKASSTNRGDSVQDSILCGNIKTNNLRVNYSMDETIDLNTLSTVTSTPYNRNKSVLHKKSALLSPTRSYLPQNRGGKPIVLNACSVILNRIVVKSPNTSSNRADGLSGAQAKRRGRPKSRFRKESTLDSKSSEPSQKEKPLDLKEPSSITQNTRPKRTTRPSDLKEPSLKPKLRRT